MEIVELSKLEEKISPILHKLAFQLESENKSYVPLLPSLLWSTLALDFSESN